MALDFVGALDGGNNGGSTTSLSFSYAVGSGGDRLLLVGLYGGTFGEGDVITGATCNGSAMVLIGKIQPGDELLRWMYLFGMLAPPTGTHNVVVSASSAVYIGAGAAEYQMVHQSGQPEAVATKNQGASTSLTTDLTTLTDEAWTVLVGGGYFDNAAPAAGAGTTRRAFDATFGGWGLFDSGSGITPPGATSLTFTYAGVSGSMQSVMAAYAPSPGIRLDAIEPDTVTQGATGSIHTLTGSGFLGSDSGASTQVHISGTGITITDTDVIDDDTIEITLDAAGGADYDERDVTVETDSGTSNAVPLYVLPGQMARPIEDIAVGNWTTFGGPTDHFDGLSDEDDATGSRSGETSSTLEVKLAPIMTPVAGAVQYRVRYRKTPS